MLLIDILIWLGVIFCVGIVFFMWKNREELILAPPLYLNGVWKLPVDVTVEELGSVESGNPLLREVIVVAHEVEEPTGALLAAVKENFGKRVFYRFIISDSSYEREVEKYIKVFKGYANVARIDDYSTEQLVFVHKLGQDWPDVPYLFYRCWQENETSTEFIFGYRGSEYREGIAERYTLMEPNQAYTIFRLVEGMVGVDVLEPIERDKFQSEGNKILKLPASGKNAAS